MFDEDYVNRFVFQKDEVIHDVFEVFIKTDEYEKKLESINTRLNNLRIDITQNAQILLSEIHLPQS